MARQKCLINLFLLCYDQIASRTARYKLAVFCLGIICWFELKFACWEMHRRACWKAEPPPTVTRGCVCIVLSD